MDNNYSSYNLLYTFKEEGRDIYSTIEISNNNILTLNNLNILQLINIEKKDNQIIDEKKEINDLLFFENKSPKAINKISKNIIYFSLSNGNDFDLNLLNTGRTTSICDVDLLEDNSSNSDSELKENFTLKLTDNINLKKERFIKIIKLKNEDKSNSNDKKENFGLNIEKEYTFPKNYELLGSISEEENLFLLNYIKEEGDFEYLFCIFDFNIEQYIYSFQFHNIWTNPKIFVKINYDFKFDKQGFVICNEDLDFIQYFYDKNYTNKIFYVNIIKAEKKMKDAPSKLLSVNKEIIMITKNNNYYLSNY